MCTGLWIRMTKVWCLVLKDEQSDVFPLVTKHGREFIIAGAGFSGFTKDGGVPASYVSMPEGKDNNSDLFHDSQWQS